jgi:Protein of unknown function (DUF4242)
VAEFIVELHVSPADAESVTSAGQRARLAARALTFLGTPVRYLRSIYIPEDETCLLVFEAASADAVREAARGATLSFERVAEAVAR